MGKRVLCLLFAMVLMVTSLFGIRAEAISQNPTKPSDDRVASRIAHSTSALVSAMFLVLAGISISLLFDRR